MRKNGQYRDASILAKRIEKIAPLEQKNGRRFKAKIDETRKKLNEKHEEERKHI